MNPVPMAIPTASDAPDVSLSSLETDSTHKFDSEDDAASNASVPARYNAESNIEDDSSAESPRSSQIDNPLFLALHFHILILMVLWTAVMLMTLGYDMMDTDNA